MGNLRDCQPARSRLERWSQIHQDEPGRQRGVCQACGRARSRRKAPRTHRNRAPCNALPVHGRCGFVVPGGGRDHAGSRHGVVPSQQLQCCGHWYLSLQGVPKPTSCALPPCWPTWGRWGLGSSQGTALPTWGQERAGSPGSVPACPAQGHFPARPSLVHGGLSPSAAERQLVGSQRHSCPHVPLSSPHTLGSSQPFGTVRSTGKMRTKQSFPSALLATHPALLCLVLGHSSGTVPPPHSPES